MRGTGNSLTSFYRRMACGAAPMVVCSIFLTVNAGQSWSSQFMTLKNANSGLSGSNSHIWTVSDRSSSREAGWQMAAVGSNQVAESSAPVSGDDVDAAVVAAKAPSTVSKSAPARRIPDRAGSTSPNDGNANFTLAMVDRIQLRVPGYASVSGKYNLSSDNTISIPGVGRMDVADLSPTGFERKLSSVLSRLMRREVTASMTVIRYKPFYITGQIFRPGAFDWRPGMTLIQAVSVAGGVSRTAARRSATGTPERELVIRQTQQRLGFALARLARFTAERDGLETIQATGLLSGFLNVEEDEQVTGLPDFIKRQNDMLAERQKMNGTRLSDLQRTKASAERELRFALERESAVLEQVKIARKLADSMEKLRNARLAPNSRYLARKSALIRNEVALSNIKHLVARSRTAVEVAQQRLDVFTRDRRALLSERIETIETQVAQHRLVLGDDADTGRNGIPTRKRLSYYIARKSERGVETIVANLFTELVPGDVVIISNSPTRRAPLTVSSTQGSTRHAGRDRQLDVHEQQMQQIMEGSISVRTAREVGPQRR